MIAAAVAVPVLFLTLAVFVVLGVRARHRAGDVEDYLQARSSQSTATLGLSFLAAGMGAWILFAPPEVGAGVGVVAVVGYAVGAAAPLIGVLVAGPRLRALLPEGRSLTEFARLRFGRAFHVWLSLVSVGYMLLFVCAELTAAAAATSLLAGIDPWVTVVAVAGSTLLYTTVGGLPASLRTDRFQAWLIMALVAAAAVAAAVAVPDAGRAWSVSGLTALDGGGVEVAATLVLAVLAANLCNQSYWQRMWAARDVRALRRGCALGAAATVPVVFVVGALGILAAGAGLELGDPPAPFFALLAGLPAAVVVVVLVLVAALAASTVDSLQTALASLAAAELGRVTMPRARLLTVALMIPAVVVALQGFSVLRLFLVADLLCASVVGPALLGLWRRATPAGAIAGAVGGLVGAVLPGVVATGSLAAAVEAATFPGAVPTLPPFLGALVVSIAVTVAVSLLGRRDADLDALARPGATRGATAALTPRR